MQIAATNQVHEEIEHLDLVKGRISMLSGSCRASKSKDTGADNRTYAQRGERPRAKRLLKPVLRFFRVRDQLVNGLLGKELAGQKASLNSAICLRKRAI
jgi:hypothetical protein